MKTHLFSILTVEQGRVGRRRPLHTFPLGLVQEHATVRHMLCAAVHRLLYVCMKWCTLLIVCMSVCTRVYLYKCMVCGVWCVFSVCMYMPVFVLYMCEVAMKCAYHEYYIWYSREAYSQCIRPEVNIPLRFIDRPTVLYIMYGTVSVQQANLPENASRDDAMLP